MVFYALCFLHKSMLLLCEFSWKNLALLYSYLKAVMLLVCHSSSEVIQAVYFILFNVSFTVLAIWSFGK